MYEKRLIDSILKKYVESSPAILVEGAKAVGKTSTCSNLANTTYSLDKKGTLEILSNSPEMIFNDRPPILLDEWQFSPELWTFIRHAVDDGLPDGFVIFTGSSPRINSKIHSGAGRIIRLKMRTFSIEERKMSENYIHVSDFFNSQKNFKISGRTSLKLVDYLDEIYRSGFPGIRSRSEMIRKKMLQDYLENIIHHDFKENGFLIKKPEALFQWLKTYAAVVGTPTKFQTIVDIAMKNNEEIPSKPTTNSYREALSILNIIEEVPAWLPMGHKLLNNISKAPKHFLLDPALITSILGIEKKCLYLFEPPKPIGKFNKTFNGQLIEALVYQSLAVYADVNNAKVSYLRLNNGAREIDFILEKGNSLILFEVKTKTAIDDEDVKHLNWLENEAQDEYQITKIALYTGEFAYTRKDNVYVIPIGMLGA
ncbi:MAG: DUF4143 domain-containing protein [Lactobacillales bacterium]|jgi:predicted AAA+ superfamily ATPase|nr:DUF4143 domain-containing protein [Lactobacillales bacterium]